MSPVGFSLFETFRQCLTAERPVPLWSLKKLPSASYWTTEKPRKTITGPPASLSLALPSVCVVKATVEAVVIAPESTLGLKQLVFLVQEVQTVVARQPADGKLVGHFGPLLTICRHSLVQLGGPGKEFRQQPGREKAGGLAL